MQSSGLLRRTNAHRVHVSASQPIGNQIAVVASVHFVDRGLHRAPTANLKVASRTMSHSTHKGSKLDDTSLGRVKKQK